MAKKVRVKAAYIDKPSGRCFGNLSPVSTWIESEVPVSAVLPLLAARFWSAVSTELLDDEESDQPKVTSLLLTGTFYLIQRHISIRSTIKIQI